MSGLVRGVFTYEERDESQCGQHEGGNDSVVDGLKRLANDENAEVDLEEGIGFHPVGILDCFDRL